MAECEAEWLRYLILGWRGSGFESRIGRRTATTFSPLSLQPQGWWWTQCLVFRLSQRTEIPCDYRRADVKEPTAVEIAVLP